MTEQLESFAAQTHRNWTVWASDDGSMDATRAILRRYQRTWGRHRLAIVNGPRAGFAANFLSLSCSSAIRADYYAYSDQDDVWEADKLERALRFLEQGPAHVPALYCSRTRLVDAHNEPIGLSPLFSRPPTFRNALVQNIGGGNTIVYNRAARALLRAAGDSVDAVSHDWWTYMVVSGCGGRVLYDPHPSLRYRQHDANLFGMNQGWRARSIRALMLWQGLWRRWISTNISSLARLRHYLTDENRIVLDQFAQARAMPLMSRLRGLLRAGVYRQTLLGNLGLVAAAVLNKI